MEATITSQNVDKRSISQSDRESNSRDLALVFLGSKPDVGMQPRFEIGARQY